MPAIEWTNGSYAKTMEGRRLVTPDDARSLIAAIDRPALDSLAREARTYLPAVLTEMATLEDAIKHDPAFVQRRAYTFGAATPNRHVADSVDMARWFADRIDWEHDSPYDIMHKAMAGYVRSDGKRVGTQLPEPFAISLMGLQPYIQDQHVAPRDELVTIYNIQHKVASMMTAICRPDWQGWTIDRHHIRQILIMAGQPVASDVAYSTAQGCAAYHLLEGFWLAYAATYFHHVPTWAAQWATWDVAFGVHQSHCGIWG